MSRALQILLVTHFFPPELGAASNRMAASAAFLARKGHRVTVLTGRPRYALRAREEDAPAPAGVRVLRGCGWRPRGSGHGERILDYGTHAASLLARGMAVRERPDVVWATVPPLGAGLAGLAIARVRGAPLVTDARDLLPEMAVSLGVLEEAGFPADASGAAASMLYRASTRITATNEGVARGIACRGIPPGRIRIVPNGIDGEFLPGVGGAPVSPDGEGPTLAYAGLLGIPQGLEVVLEAAARLQDLSPVRFVLLGDGVRRAALEAQARRLGLRNIVFRDPVPRRELPGILSGAAALLVVLRPGLEGSLPSKILEAMALGRPVVCAAAGEAARLVEDSGCGVVVPPGDPAALAAAARSLVERRGEWEERGRRGREFGHARLRRERFLPLLEDLLLEAAEEGPP